MIYDSNLFIHGFDTKRINHAKALFNLADPETVLYLQRNTVSGTIMVPSSVLRTVNETLRM